MMSQHVCLSMTQKENLETHRSHLDYLRLRINNENSVAHIAFTAPGHDKKAVLEAGLHNRETLGPQGQPTTMKLLPNLYE